METRNDVVSTERSAEMQVRALEEPFEPREIRWRVTHATGDGSRGAVIPFADPRAYTDRLNLLFTPSGWTRSFDVTTISPVTRTRKDKAIQTGKVLVTCTVTIADLGTHAGSGEEWADEENAMTASEAQAFKRACSCFGLGRYLYRFAEMWVPLNDRRLPMEYPSLPNWALPKSAQPGPIDPHTTAKIEGFRRRIGVSIYGEILGKAARVDRAGAIPNAHLQQEVLRLMEWAKRGVDKAHSLAEQIDESTFVALMDELQIGSLSSIQNVEMLKVLVEGLDCVLKQPAA